MALVQWTRQYLREYHEANDVPPRMSRPQVVVWTPPPMSRYKVNVDCAVFSAQKSEGVGVLIRDPFGQVVAAISKKINAALGALEAEAKAFEAGLQFALDVGVHDFILEGDSMLLCNALSGYSLPPSSVASVVRGINMNCGVLSQVNFSHVKRQGNRPAHLLEKYVLGIVDFLTWIEENPYFLVQTLIHDVSILCDS